jgi:hypothetical protein
MTAQRLKEIKEVLATIRVGGSPWVHHNVADELVAAVEELRAALIEHRADLHQGSRRPCATCRRSAEVLGISGLVPNWCASGRDDAEALKGWRGEKQP